MVKLLRLLKSRCLLLLYYCADLWHIYLRKTAGLDELKAEGKPIILFISNKFTPRIEKLAFAINSLQIYRLVLATKVPVNRFSGPYIACFRIHSHLKAAWLIRKLNPKLVHLFSIWNFDISNALLHRKSEFRAKFIFDDYDVFAGMIKQNVLNRSYPGQLEKEKYCLEHADGICCRSLEIQYAKRKYGYKYSGKRIFFPEYMWHLPLAKAEDKRIKERVVYAGGFNKLFYKVANELDKINCQLDVYPSNPVPRDNSVPTNLNLLPTVPSNKLISVLSDYKFAIQMPPEIAEGKGYYTREKRIYAMSGKMFDYMESGLKVIISGYDLLLFIFRRYSTFILLDPDNPIGSISEKISTYKEEENSFRNKIEKITIEGNIERLNKFYKIVQE